MTLREPFYYAMEYLEGVRQFGVQAEMANSPKITFRCPTVLLERISTYCQELGVRQSTAILMLLEAGLVSDTHEPIALSDTAPMTVGQSDRDSEWSAWREPDVEEAPPSEEDLLDALIAELDAQPAPRRSAQPGSVLQNQVAHER